MSSSSVQSACLFVGSANADIFITADVIPQVGETVGGALTKIGPGGKGSNQAGGSHKAAQKGKVHLIASLGQDQYAELFHTAYTELEMSTTLFETSTPTGQAYIIISKKSADNSIIVCPGANMVFPPELQLHTSSPDKTKCPLDALVGDAKLEQVKEKLLEARVLGLQREIPESVNLFFASTAQHINSHYDFEAKKCRCQENSHPSIKPNGRIFVMLDVGGIGEVVDTNLLPFIDLISFNETEMARVYAQAHSVAVGAVDVGAQTDNVKQLLTLDHIVDPVHRGVLLREPSFSQNNESVVVLNDYSIFSGQTPTAPLSTTTINLSTQTQSTLPYDISSLLHAANAINGMARPVGTESRDSIKVLITLGSHGSLLLSKNTIHHYQRPIVLEKHEIVDSTGCGDAYRGTLATKYVELLEQEETVDWAQCMRFATAGATVCLATLGTLPAMGKREQILALLDRVPE